MPDFSPQTVQYGTENRSWLASKKGTDETETITLDLSTFTAGTHYPNGYIPSGITLGKITASGKFGPYDDTKSDGRQVMDGHLYSSETVNVGTTVIATALLTNGKVRVANLPAGNGLDAAGKVDVGARFRYL